MATQPNPIQDQPFQTETVDSLAGKIKAKYPDYAAIDNAELVHKTIQKYPEYQTRLSGAELQRLSGGKPFLSTMEDSAARSLGYDPEKIQNQPTLGSQWKEAGRETLGNVKSLGESFLHDPSGATGIESLATQVEGGGRKVYQGARLGDRQKLAEGTGELLSGTATALAPEAPGGAGEAARDVRNAAGTVADTARGIRPRLASTLRAPEEPAPAPQATLGRTLGNGKPSPSLIVDPNSAPPPVKMTYQSYPRETLVKMAAGGNVDAIRELQRNPAGYDLPPNAKYMIEGNARPSPFRNYSESGVPEGSNLVAPRLGEYPKPREVVHFGAEEPSATLGGPTLGRSSAVPDGTSGYTPVRPRQAPPVSPEIGAQPEQMPSLGQPPRTLGSTLQGAPRVKAVPVAQRFDPEVISQAEGEMRGALELGNTMPTAGRYFAENTFDEHPLAGRYKPSAGERPGGTWSGISSQKGNIAGQYPWFNDPDISLSKLTSAIQQGRGALYERIVGKIAEGITKERGAATAAISEHIPQLRELAGQVQEIEPELAQALNDLADGKLTLAPDQLKAYVTEKITDATSAAQFSREIDAAADEARSSSPAETDRTPDPARPGSGEAGPSTQAPELSTKPLGRASRRPVEPIGIKKANGIG